MATADDSGVLSSIATSAKEYARERLGESDSPLTPSELADEWGCSNGHMRNELRDLLEEGECERVARGQYVRSDDDLGPQDAASEDDGGAETGGDGQGDDAAAEAESEDDQSPPESDGGDADTPVAEAAGAAAVGGASLLATDEWGRTEWVVVFALGAFLVWFLFIRSDDGGEQDDRDDQEEEIGVEEVSLTEGM